MDVYGHAHLDMVSIGFGHLFGPLSNRNHPLLPKTEMVQLVKPNWAVDGPFDSSNLSVRSTKQWWGLQFFFFCDKRYWNRKKNINNYPSQAAGNTLALTTLYSLESIISKRKEESSAPQEGKPSWTRRLLTDDALLCSKIR